MNEQLAQGLIAATQWNPPQDWIRITTIDAHATGEPLRVIVGGFPDLPGETIIAKRRYAHDNYDSLRTALMWEPRGHADMYGCIITPPVSEQADFGVLFTHNEGFSTMCGHGIIGATTVALETGIIPMSAPETTVRIDTPAGLVTAYAKVEGKRVTSVCFHNVPSFVLVRDETIDVPGLGKVRYDIVFGGAFYAFVNADEIGVSCTPETYRSLIETGMAIKRAVMAARPITHPFEEDLSFLYGTIFLCSPLTVDVDSRNVCIFAQGEVDRSPTGTGVSARMALHYAQGEIGIGEPMVIESLIGTRFTGRVVRETTFGPYAAVIPAVEGSAYLVGRNELWIDPQDPLKDGFILR